MGIYLSPNLRKISNGDSALVYDCKTGKNLILHKGALVVMDLLARGMTPKEIMEEYEAPGLDSLFENLKEKKLIITNAEDIPNPKCTTSEDQIVSGRLLQHLRLNVTERCNLDCTYCFERESNIYGKKRVMEWDIARKAIDEFISLAIENKQSRISVRFFGGEPLLNWNLVDRCIEYVKEITPDDIHVSFIMNTNGTLINDEIALKLSENKVAISLSLDGVGTYHDNTRKYINGQGSFDIIDKNIDILIRNQCQFNLSVVCSDFNFPHLRELIDYMKKKQDEKGYRMSVNFNNIQICNREGVDMLPIKEKVGYLVDVLKYAREVGIYSYGGLTHFVFDKLVRGSIGNYCAGTGSEFSVDPDGNILPCSGQQIVLGTLNNFRDIFKSEIYKQLAIRRAGYISQCVDCDVEGFCAGGCLAEVMSDSGKEKGTYRGCDLQKHTFTELVKEYILS